MKTFLDLHSPDFGAGLSCAPVANANKETLDPIGSSAINHQVKGSVLGGPVATHPPQCPLEQGGRLSAHSGEVSAFLAQETTCRQS